MSESNVKIGQHLPSSLAITDKAGNPAKVDGAPVWSVSDDGLGAFKVSEDGMSALFVPAGKVGDVKVQVSADADLGEGVKTIIGEGVIHIVGGDAAVVGLSFGEAVDA